MVLVIRILLLVSAGLSFGYGALRFMAKKAALFKTLIALSLGCFMLGRLYEVINLLVKGSASESFNIGMLAVVGGFMFIFSASFGQMDGLVDDKSPELIKYRLISLAAPACLCVLLIPILSSGIPTAGKVTASAMTAVIALAAYYNLKHLIIPDVSFGIIRSIRGYNLMALGLALLYETQIVAERLESEMLWIAASILLILLCPVILPVMERGSRKWTL